MSRYKIELLRSVEPGARDVFWRSKREFVLGQPQILELTDEEVEVFKNEKRLKVSDATDGGEPVDGGDVVAREGTVPSEDADSEENLDSPSETVEAETVEQEETVVDEDPAGESVEDLLKLSREDLNTQASEAGIDDPESFANKTEVAQAIVDAR